MATVDVRICTACYKLAPTWGPCPKCGAIPGETADDLKAREVSAEMEGADADYTGEVVPPFEVYEDYDGNLHIIDGTTRIVLSDVYSYDQPRKTGADAVTRMARIAEALTRGWNAD